ncbi:CN hydrolase domain-containing protein [Abeliophyllum distichum]|uniref:CN hydrolase domain-containing protein n=1 Tax=Abeliophyllum distichum TaxID=126358 RepID=A0ABD1QV25_9LAMI
MAAASIGMLSSSSVHYSNRFLKYHYSISHLYRSSFCPIFHSHSAFGLVRQGNSIDKINKNCVKPIRTVTAATRMASPFKPEEARIPPAIPLPSPSNFQGK